MNIFPYFLTQKTCVRQINTQFNYIYHVKDDYLQPINIDIKIVKLKYFY